MYHSNPKILSTCLNSKLLRISNLLVLSSLKLWVQLWGQENNLPCHASIFKIHLISLRSIKHFQKFQPVSGIWIFGHKDSYLPFGCEVCSFNLKFPFYLTQLGLYCSKFKQPLPKLLLTILSFYIFVFGRWHSFWLEIFSILLNIGNMSNKFNIHISNSGQRQT